MLLLVIAFIVIGLWAVRRTWGTTWWYFSRAEAAVLVAIAVLLPLTIWHRSVKGRVFEKITALVAPLPGWSDPEDGVAPMGMQPFLTALNGNASQARRELAALRADSTRIYMVRAPWSPDSAIAFYRDEAHRPGWQITADDGRALFFTRGNRELMIGATTANDGGTQVIYMVQPTARP